MPVTGNVGSQGTKVGEVLKWNLRDSYNLEPISVVVPVGGLPNGAVLENTSAAPDYTLVAVATTANANAILLDKDVYGDDIKAGGTFTLAALVRGPAEVSKGALSYSVDVDLPAEVDAVIAALEVNTSILVKDTV